MPFIETHIECAGCGSSDGRSLNEDGSSYCFVCDKYFKPEGVDYVRHTSPEAAVRLSERFTDFDHTKVLLQTRKAQAIPQRGLTTATCERYSCIVDGDRIIYGYYAPSDQHNPVAAKIRLPDKRFTTAGSWAEGGLYGQQLFPSGGRYITITEGEFDAMSAYQMQGSKYPCVSVRNGAGGALKDCKAAYEWIDSFDTVVICFDADEPGTKAASQVAQLFGGKSKIVKHLTGYKDPSDYLQAGKSDVFNQAWWAAEQYIPDGIINAETLWDEVNLPMEDADVMYPWPGVNVMTYGIRMAEMVTITAGSGLGKSQFVREIVYFVLKHTEANVGLLFLEESTRKTALSLMSLAVDKTLHLPTTVSTETERKQAFDATVGTGRVFMFDHFGSTDIDNVVSRVRYMAKALDCKYIMLDHVSIVVSAQAAGDERKAIDEIMTKLRMLVQETKIALFVVSHLRRPEGKGHEEGSNTSLSQLRGSASIAQLSDIVLGLERNGQAEDATDRNKTKVRVLKNRFSGETGLCSTLFYNNVTGRMNEIHE
jgi:twinkle protein